MKGDGNPFLGVPGGAYPKVESPDGVFQGGSAITHSLYDNAISIPVIPGDYDAADEIPAKASGR